jgi:hypothetical protein
MSILLQEMPLCHSLASRPIRNVTVGRPLACSQFLPIMPRSWLRCGTVTLVLVRVAASSP